MRRSIVEILLWPVASALVVLALVFGLMLDNVGSIEWSHIVRPIAVLAVISVLATILLMVVHFPLARIFPSVVFLYFNFYAINSFIFDLERFLPLSLLTLFIVALYPLCIICLYILLRRVDGKKAASCTCVIVGAVAVATFAKVVPNFSYKKPPVINHYFESQTSSALSRYAGQSSHLPDIIYIVPDRYASSATLRKVYGFDNSSFYRNLRKRGFRVFEDSWSNYPKTFLSLASTLNSGYLTAFKKLYGPNTSDRRPVHHLIENNVVQDRLRKLGYKFHNYGNFWEPTRVNKWAIVNETGYASGSLQNFSEFESALLKKTPTRLIFKLFSGDSNHLECKRIKNKLGRIRTAGNERHPVFIFAHMLIPHEPIVTDAEGRCLDRMIHYRNKVTSGWSGSVSKVVEWKEYKAAYVEFLKYFNSEILHIIDDQLKRRGPSGRKLIFIIQSDEGPHPKFLRDRLGREMNLLSSDELRMKFGIINALRLPNNMGQAVPKLSTPVNNWRVIFEAVTGTKINLLPDRVYTIPDKQKKIFDFCEVTDTLAGRDAGLPSCIK